MKSGKLVLGQREEKGTDKKGDDIDKLLLMTF